MKSDFSYWVNFSFAYFSKFTKRRPAFNSLHSLGNDTGSATLEEESSSLINIINIQMTLYCYHHTGCHCKCTTAQQRLRYRYTNLLLLYILYRRWYRKLGQRAPGGVWYARCVWAFASVGVIRRGRSAPWFRGRPGDYIVPLLRNREMRTRTLHYIITIIIFGRARTECVSNAYLPTHTRIYIYIYIL